MSYVNIIYIIAGHLMAERRNIRRELEDIERFYMAQKLLFL
jgi:hypothetical protein